MRKRKRGGTLKEKYRPSPPCSCEVCRSFCARPGWWTVEEAERALEAGYGDRMMLEISPELTFGVLSPAFGGCEAKPALQAFAKNGCCFLEGGLCALHGTGFQPLECRVCHHARPGAGRLCHADIEKDWQSERGRALVDAWAARYYLYNRYRTGKKE
jgi:Fe-S-cluster containining protein